MRSRTGFSRCRLAKSPSGSMRARSSRGVAPQRAMAASFVQSPVTPAPARLPVLRRHVLAEPFRERAHVLPRLQDAVLDGRRGDPGLDVPPAARAHLAPAQQLDAR